MHPVNLMWLTWCGNFSVSFNSLLNHHLRKLIDHKKWQSIEIEKWWFFAIDFYDAFNGNVWIIKCNKFIQQTFLQNNYENKSMNHRKSHCICRFFSLQFDSAKKFFEFESISIRIFRFHCMKIDFYFHFYFKFKEKEEEIPDHVNGDGDVCAVNVDANQFNCRSNQIELCVNFVQFNVVVYAISFQSISSEWKSLRKYLIGSFVWCNCDDVNSLNFASVEMFSKQVDWIWFLHSNWDSENRSNESK